MRPLTKMMRLSDVVISPVVVLRYFSPAYGCGNIMEQKQGKSPVWAMPLGGVEDCRRRLRRYDNPPRAQSKIESSGRNTVKIVG
jgi:hypothetical protein